MNEDDAWIHLDGPEPERLQPLFDALRDVLPPATPEDAERAVERFFATFDFNLPQLAEPAVPGSPAASSAASEPPASAARLPPGIPPTAVDIELPPRVKELVAGLPFKPPSPNRPTAPKTAQVPVMNRHLGETALDDETISKAVAATVAVLPFAGNTVGRGVVPFPRLTLEQYTSFRAELAVHPDRAQMLLGRYHMLHDAARAALIEDWDRRLAASPQERAEFDRLFAMFTAYLRQISSIHQRCSVT